jgi:hypothetical protein
MSYSRELPLPYLAQATFQFRIPQRSLREGSIPAATLISKQECRMQTTETNFGGGPKRPHPTKANR